jgi:hypothetical protein
LAEQQLWVWSVISSSAAVSWGFGFLAEVNIEIGTRNHKAGDQNGGAF